MLSLLIAIPVVLVILFNLGPRRISRACALGVTVLYLVLQALAVLGLPQSFWKQSVPWVGTFLSWDLAIDPLTFVMLISIGIVSAISAWIGRAFLTDKDQQFYLYNLLLILVAGLNGIVLVRDVFSLYIFLEIAAVSSFILITLHKEQEGFEGAFKYIVFSAVATVMMLGAIALLIMGSGSTSFAAISQVVHGSPQNFFVLLSLGLFITGFCMKSGVIPFHGWLPDAYSAADIPVSVMLAGIVTKTVGVYSLLRVSSSIFTAFPKVNAVLMFIGALSIVIGALGAIVQSDLKRLFSYSSISQVGYIVLSFGCGTALGMAGALFHIFNHAIFKSLLFLNAGVVEDKTGTRNIRLLSGLACRMPMTNISSLIAGLATAGIPPLSGFWSKLIIVVALWSAGFHVYAFIAVLASVITLGYMLVVQRKVFWGRLNEQSQHVEEGSTPVVIAEVVLLAIIIGVGLLFPIAAKIFTVPAEFMLGR